MAARKRRTTKKSSRRRRSTGRRRAVVSTLRRGAYAVNRPRRRRRFRRNPNWTRVAIQTAQDSIAVGVGSAAGRTIGNLLPSFGNPVADAAKGVLVAIGVRMIASRFMGSDVARFAAAGAMQAPIRDLIVGFVPAAAPFLSSYDQPALSSYADVAGWIGADGEQEEVEVGAYSEGYGG